MNLARSKSFGWLVRRSPAWTLLAVGIHCGLGRNDRTNSQLLDQYCRCRHLWRLEALCDQSDRIFKCGPLSAASAEATNTPRIVSLPFDILERQTRMRMLEYCGNQKSPEKYCWNVRLLVAEQGFFQTTFAPS